MISGVGSGVTGTGGISAVGDGTGVGVGVAAGGGVADFGGSGVGVAGAAVGVADAGASEAAWSVQTAVGCVPSMKYWVSVLGQCAVATIPESEQRDTFTFSGSAELCGAIVAGAILLVVWENTVGVRLA